MIKRDVTLCFFLKEDQILLGRKKYGNSLGIWNGFGGKVEEGESVEEGMLREVMEEVSLVPIAYEKMAEVTFFNQEKDRETVCHVYISKDWKGEPLESNEMFPAWYAIKDIPFHKMYEDDSHWLPLLLQGKKFKARFDFEDSKLSRFEIVLGL